MRSLNKNDTRRLQLVGPFLKDPKPAKYDIAYFEGLDPRTLLTLISEGFVDIEECQNDSPSIRDFLVFMYQHEDCFTCHGYIVSPERQDYRLSVEGLSQARNEVTDDIKKDFALFCRSADELGVDPKLHSWWD